MLKKMMYDFIFFYNKKTKGGLPGIEPGTASTLKKNHTTRPKPLSHFFKNKKYI